MRTFTLYFEDLEGDAQEELCKALKTTKEEENWDVIPLTIIEREEKLNDPLNPREVQESLNRHLRDIEEEGKKEE